MKMKEIKKTKEAKRPQKIKKKNDWCESPMDHENYASTRAISNLTEREKKVKKVVSIPPLLLRPSSFFNFHSWAGCKWKRACQLLPSTGPLDGNLVGFSWFMAARFWKPVRRQDLARRFFHPPSWRLLQHERRIDPLAFSFIRCTQTMGKKQTSVSLSRQI